MRAALRLGVAVCLFGLMAGCLAAPGATGAEVWHLGGSFTPERTRADLDAWCEVAKRFANECALMESFPEQFALTLGSEDECELARAEVIAIPHTRVGECRRLAPAGEPDAPTSSGAGA